MSSQATNQAPRLFPNTRWSVVLAAKQRQSPDSAEALEVLCRTYWYPLYAFVRSSGHSPHDAQDLTQEFFARLLSKEYLRAVDPEKGRFRTFLRMALKRPPGSTGDVCPRCAAALLQADQTKFTGELGESLANDFDEHALALVAVEFAVEDLFPRVTFSFFLLYWKA